MKKLLLCFIACHVQAASLVVAGQSNAKGLVRSPNFEVINVAEDNSSLSEWAKGSGFYNSLTKTISDKRPKALIWYQGEWEAINITDSKHWAELFMGFVANVRQDSRLETLHVFFFELNSHSRGFLPAWNIVREQQESVRMFDVTLIKSEGCEMDDDRIHYTPDGYDCLMDRIAKYL